LALGAVVQSMLRASGDDISTSSVYPLARLKPEV